MDSKSIAYGPLKVVLKNHAGFRVLRLIVFTHFKNVFPQFNSTLLLALPFWNYHSHCSVFKVRAPTFLRSDFSIQPIKLGTEIRSYQAGGPKWTRTTDLTIISRVL